MLAEIRQRVPWKPALIVVITSAVEVSAGLGLALKPIEVLTVAFLSIVLVLVAVKPKFGAYFLVALIPLEAVWSSLGGSWALKLLGAAVVFVWFGKTILSTRSLAFHLSRQFILSIVLVMLAVASGLWAVQLTQDYYTAVFSYASLMVFYLFIAEVVSTEADVRDLLAALVFSVALSAGIGWWQYLSGTGPMVNRATGGGGDPNEFAGVLACTLPIVAALVTCSQSRPLKVVYALLIPIMTIAVLASGSRAGALALLLAAIYIVTLLPAAARRIGAVVVLPSIIIGWLLVGDTVARRFQELTVFGGNQELERIGLWRIAGQMIQDRFLVGVGLGGFRYVAPEIQSVTPDLGFVIVGNPVAHNALLAVWAELGTVGLLLFVAILGIGVYKLIAVIRSLHRPGVPSKKWEILYRSVLAGYLLCLFMAATLDLERSKFLWLFIILSDVIHRLNERRPSLGNTPDG